MLIQPSPNPVMTRTSAPTTAPIEPLGSALTADMSTSSMVSAI
jgi:hypothetical protein